MANTSNVMFVKSYLFILYEIITFLDQAHVFELSHSCSAIRDLVIGGLPQLSNIHLFCSTCNVSLIRAIERAKFTKIQSIQVSCKHMNKATVELIKFLVHYSKQSKISLFIENKKVCEYHSNEHLYDCCKYREHIETSWQQDACKIGSLYADVSMKELYIIFFEYKFRLMLNLTSLGFGSIDFMDVRHNFKLMDVIIKMLTDINGYKTLNTNDIDFYLRIDKIVLKQQRVQCQLLVSTIASMLTAISPHLVEFKLGPGISATELSNIFDILIRNQTRFLKLKTFRFSSTTEGYNTLETARNKFKQVVDRGRLENLLLYISNRNEKYEGYESFFQTLSTDEKATNVLFGARKLCVQDTFEKDEKKLLLWLRKIDYQLSFIYFACHISLPNDLSLPLYVITDIETGSDDHNRCDWRGTNRNYCLTSLIKRQQLFVDLRHLNDVSINLNVFNKAHLYILDQFMFRYSDNSKYPCMEDSQNKRCIKYQPMEIREKQGKQFVQITLILRDSRFTKEWIKGLVQSLRHSFSSRWNENETFRNYLQIDESILDFLSINELRYIIQSTCACIFLGKSDESLIQHVKSEIVFLTTRRFLQYLEVHSSLRRSHIISISVSALFGYVTIPSLDFDYGRLLGCIRQSFPD